MASHQPPRGIGTRPAIAPPAPARPVRISAFVPAALRRSLRPIGAVLLLAACGGGGDGEGPTTPPPTVTLDNIAVTPTTVTLDAGQSQLLSATGRSASGATVNGVAFAYSSSNTGVASVSSSGSVVGIAAGTATITVSGSLGGVTRTATVGVTVNGALPMAVTVVAGANSNDFTPASVAIARGGTVTWTFGAILHNVDFQGTAGAPAPIPNTSNASVARTFNNAGTFGYSCSLHSGMNGTVQVP